MLGEFSLINKTKGKLPSLPFVDLKNDILGTSYNLSVAYVSEKTSRQINKQYRNKDKSTNVLSFALSKNDGELVLCPAVMKREYKDFDKTFEEFLIFLVIHGMLHLKGLVHSSKMERAESKYCRKYDTKYFNRNRRGVFDRKSDRRGIRERRKTS